VAGSPYGCNIVEKDDTDYCGTGGGAWQGHKGHELDKKVKAYMHHRAEKKLIDPLSSLKDRRVYLYSGQFDDVVNTSVMRAVSRQLSPWVGEASIHHDFDTPSTHGWVVDGSDCEGKPGTNDSWCSKCCCDPDVLLACGHDLPGLMLQHLLNRSLPEHKGAVVKSNLLSVPQDHYVPHGRTANNTGIWHTGYVYAPKACRGKDFAHCSVHVYYHGCDWGVEYTTEAALYAFGLMEWAEAMDVVLVFPQSSKTVDEGGCWDWTGETDSHFDTTKGPQLSFVMLFLADLRRILNAGEGDMALV